MIEKRVLNALKSDDAEQRKKAIMRLAKSLDRDALPYLARVYKHDDDPQVREMARKGGVYIKKNAPKEEEAEPEADDEGYTYSYSLYEDEPEEDEDEPEEDSMPEADVKVGQVAQQRAQAFLNQAFDMEVAGNVSGAMKALQKALKTDPSLMKDYKTRNIAASVTGLDADRAVRELGPGSKTIQDESRNSSGLIFTLVLILTGLLLVATFVLSPWMDVDGGFQDDDASYSGLEVANNEEDIAFALAQVSAFRQAMESGNLSGLNTSGQRDLISYLPYLTGAAGVIVIVLGFIAILTRGGSWYWLVSLIASVAAAAGLGWFFFAMNDFYDLFGSMLEGFQQMSGEMASQMGDQLGLEAEDVQGVEINGVMDLLGLGFWANVGATAIMLLLSTVGMAFGGSSE